MATKKEKIKRNLKKQGPITAILIMIIFIAVISFVLSLFKVSGNITEAETLETSFVKVNNILSKDGIKYILNNSISNFSLMECIIYIIISLMAISVLESSGLLNHILKPFKNVKSRYITLIFVFLGIISTIIGDYSYTFMLPLAGVAYKILGKNPTLGIITTFIGLTIGYGVGIVPNYQDYIISSITTKSAHAIDINYTYHMFSTYFINVASVIILTIFTTLFIEKNLSKKFLRYEFKENFNVSKKALVTTSIFAMIFIWVIAYSIIPGLPFSGMLLNDNTNVYIEKVFGNNSAFGNGYMLIILGISLICSYIYGRISGNIRNNNDITYSVTKSFENTGYIFVLLFFTSIMLGLLEWSNIPTVISTNVVDFIGRLNFGGIPLIILVFISIVLISILMPMTVTKWNILAPIFVPLFMRANITPQFTQTLFVTSDAIGKLFSPIYLYLILAIGLIYKHDNEADANIFTIMKKIMPVILLISLTYFIVLIGWYLIGLPLGFNSSITM